MSLVEGLDHLRAAQQRGGVLLLCFHSGPCIEALCLTIAGHPVSTIGRAPAIWRETQMERPWRAYSSKGATISHRNCLPHTWAVGQRYAMSERDRMLQTLPLSGSWGLLVSLMTVIYGATLVMPRAPLAGEILRLLEAERIALWHTVDTTLISVLDHPSLPRHDLSTLRSMGVSMTGGGRRGFFEDIVGRLGIRDVRHTYGMTEINSQALCHVADDPPDVRRRSGGYPFDGLEVRVADLETGMYCPAGREGELQFRGRSVPRGYYGKPEETAAAFDPAGWFRTGDLAVQDDAGRTFFLGRLGDTLRIGHTMVAPAEIEAFLMEHPGVAQAFVVGVPDPRLGDAPVGYVIARPGHAVTETDLQDHCRGRLASIKTPRHIWVVDDVPRARGPHGDKAQRAVLREMALRALGLSA